MNYDKIEIKNRKVKFQYDIVETESAGIKLLGTEVKSIRQDGMSLKGAWCFIDGNTIILKGSFISKYEKKGYMDHEPERDRTLLMTKKQIKKWHEKVKEQKLTIVPLRLYTTKTGMFKVEVALVKGKKTWDKKDSIKERDIDREARRELKNY